MHPVGFLASLASLTVLSVYSTGNGLSLALLACKTEPLRKSSEPTPSPAALLRLLVIWVPILLVTLVTAAVIALSLFLAVVLVSPLSYEDVAAALRGGPFPEFGDLPVPRWIGARALGLAWLIGTASLAIVARLVWRANLRTFDEAVGRPVRLPPGPEADRIEGLRRGATAG